MSELKPRIYVACLAAYNNGYLHGEWIDADQEVDALYADIKKILASSPIPEAEEWAIHDFEDFGDISLSEYAGMETVSSTPDSYLSMVSLALQSLLMSMVTLTKPSGC